MGPGCIVTRLLFSLWCGASTKVCHRSGLRDAFMPRRTLRRCDCCEWKHYMIDRDGDLPQQSICDDCSPHYRVKLEPQERSLAREAAHAIMWRELARRIGDAYDQQALALEAERESAFAARDTKRNYASILDDLSDLHQRAERNRCTCGLQSPCETAVVLERRYGRTYARRKVAAEERRQRLIAFGLDPDTDTDDNVDLPA
jgi:hypothetical protein